MVKARHSTHRVRIPNDLGCILRPLLDRLLADDDDGDTFQKTIGPFFTAERPLVLIERGDTTRLYVEGPWYPVCDRSFPLGAQLATEVGWFDLTSIEAAELIGKLREAIDATAFRWLIRKGKLSKVQQCRRDRNRAVDDPLALRQMAAAAGRLPQETEDDHD